MSAAEVMRAVVVTAEVMGHEMSALAAEAIARELARYSPDAVGTALRRCQRELTGRLSLARIIERLPGQHIGADEAWALCPRSEGDSVVWTDEIASAFAAAEPLLAEGDQVAARMAFREAYARNVALAAGEPPRWWPSLGHDPRGRVEPVRAAVALGRLSAEYADREVGHLMSGDERRKLAALPAGNATRIGDVLQLSGKAPK